MFFFPEYSFNQTRMLFPHLYHMLIEEEKVAIKMAQEVFNYQCRRFLGLGFFLSFIPGTNAFVARKVFGKELTESIDSIQDNIKQQNFFQKLVFSSYIQAPFLHFLLLGPLWSALGQALSQFNSPLFSIRKSIKYPLSRILRFFPIVSDLASPNPGENFLHSLLNPVRFVSQVLFFSHLLLNRIFEVPSKSIDSNLLIAGLKFVTAASFAVVSIPVVLIREILDIPYQILKNFVYQPLKFIALTVAQPFRDTDDLQERTEDMLWENQNPSGFERGNVFNPAMPSNETPKQENSHTTNRSLNKVFGSNSTTLKIDSIDDNDDSSQNTGSPRSRSASFSGSPSNKFFDNNLNASTEKVIVVQENLHQDPGVTQIPSGPA